MKTVVCIKWGTRYGPECVNRIYRMVARNITPPFQKGIWAKDRPQRILVQVREALRQARPLDLPALAGMTPVHGHS